MSANIKLSPAGKLQALSTVLEYPTEKCAANLDAAIELLHDNPLVCFALKEFQTRMQEMRTHELEELYTRTFDLAPICIPYVSSHIYGDENFERGALMSGLQERYEECGFNTHGELPDHIATIMRFAPNFSDEELQDLLEYCLLQALQRMHESLKDADNPFQHILKSALIITESERRGKIL